MGLCECRERADRTGVDLRTPASLPSAPRASADQNSWLWVRVPRGLLKKSLTWGGIDCTRARPTVGRQKLATLVTRPTHAATAWEVGHRSEPGTRLSPRLDVGGFTVRTVHSL